jgi:hypothetical protein
LSVRIEEDSPHGEKTTWRNNLENRKMIGQILVEKGYVTLAQLNEARRQQLLAAPGSVRPLLGEALLQLGYATPGQIEEALKLQKGHPPSSPSAPNPNL